MYHVILSKCLRSKVKKVFSCKCVSFYILGRSNFQFCRCIEHIMKRTLGNCFMTQSQDQCMDVLVKLNASPPKPLYIAVTCISHGI